MSTGDRILDWALGITSCAIRYSLSRVVLLVALLAIQQKEWELRASLDDLRGIRRTCVGLSGRGWLELRSRREAFLYV